jgi:quinohemoprotein amine dehydrogenase
MPRSLLGTALRGFVAAAVMIAAAHTAEAQRGGGGGGRAGAGGPAPGAASPRDTTRGFPISDRATIQACGECHLRDTAGVMQRLSFERKTPEGWEMSVRRMVSLNNVSLDPATARAVVRYLSDHQGLAPAELRPGRF